MDSNQIVLDTEIHNRLINAGFQMSDDEGRLMLAELLLKSAAGYMCSHTETEYMRSFSLRKVDGTPNKAGREFLCSLIYKHSNLKPDIFYLMAKYRE